ncbi:MAG: alpha/beta hydrolase [Myxococcota bacterium]
MKALFLPGMDGGARLSRRFRDALEPVVEAEAVTYPADQALGYAKLEVLVRSRIEAHQSPVALIAESFSGPLAIRLAAAGDLNLRCLVLVATFARSPAPRILSPFVRTAMFTRAPPAFVVRHFMLGQDADYEEVDDVQRAIRGVEGHVLASRLRAVLEVDVTQRCEDIRVPVLYLRPTDDRLVRRPLPRQRQWQVRAVEGPHLLLQSRPRLSARIVSEFVQHHR